MSRFVRLAAFGLTLAVTAPLSAQPAPVTFETVDSLRVQAYDSGSGAVHVTGLVQGEGEPTTHTFSGKTYASCERMLTLSMEKPGRYLVTIIKATGIQALSCELTRRK